MLTQNCIFLCIRPYDWFAAVDLRMRTFMFRASLNTGCFSASCSRGEHITTRYTSFEHLSRLGLQVNWEKSKLSLVQRISFGMELDSVNLTAHLSLECAQSMLNCLESFQCKRAVPLKQFQRLLGHMTSAVTPLGLLIWDHFSAGLTNGSWDGHGDAARTGSQSPCCHQTFSPWSDLAFLRAGVPQVQVSRHVVVSTDASTMGWSAMCNGHSATGSGQGPNCSGISIASSS